MALATQTKREPLITVKTGIYCAVVGALGCILTLFAIPVAPNIAINLYVFSGVLVGGTSGWFVGMLGGLIGSLYTPVLWGWFGALPYAAAIGLFAGLFSQKWGLRPTIGAILGGQIIYQATVGWYGDLVIMGLPWPIFWIGMGTTTLQLIAAGLLAEALMSIPAIKKRLPKTTIKTVPWVARSAFLRHPWVEKAK